MRTKMPQQSAQIRATNFKEVALGYSKEQAQAESSRCLHCKNPRCVEGCPVSVNIPQFIAEVKQGNIESAYEIITATNSLPAVCGRVCPQENQCEGKCVLGIKGESVAIGNLERYVADNHKESKAVCTPKTKGKRIAIVGAGPAGLSCAGELNNNGYDVTVFEALHIGGGVLSYGIPEFRLPKKVVNAEIDSLTAKGVKLITNRVIGRNETIDELFSQGFSAVFVGSGAGLPSFMKISGEELKGVYSANEYLTRVNLMHAYDDRYDTPIFCGKRVVVVGGGNVAMDSARCALRLGAEVHIVYRRSRNELPARAEEVENAEEEGVIFDLLTNPVRIIGNEGGWVSGIECVKMQLGEPDSSGRRSPVVIDGSNFVISADSVIIAIGTTPNPLIRMTTKGLDFNKKGCLITMENGATSKQGVYAGGDAVTGAATVISAMGAGRRAAKAIDEYLTEK